ncbi:MAG: hypothetical protein ABIZ36_13995 [Gemmatimonadaceae bacterium]
MRHAARAVSLFMFVAVALVIFGTPAASNAQSSANSADLAAAKTALSRYSDPLAAVRDGYFSTVACVDFPKGATDGPVVYPPGAMGVHFLNTANIGPKLDPTKPQILIYEQIGNKLKLTAAEWFMPVEAAGGVAPTIFGQSLNGPMNGHEPIMPASLKHYDLHVWFWKNNPKGMFTSTNSTVKCAPGGTYTVAVGEHHH